MRLTPAEAGEAIRRGALVPYFQPIEDLQTGECRGFEALARLDIDGRLVPPVGFLDALSNEDRMCLFGAMVGHAIALLKSSAAQSNNFYVSVNVEISLLLVRNFPDVMRYLLELNNYSGEHLVLELLEGEDIVRFSDLHAVLEELRRIGIVIALDDIGAGYASLSKLRDLPIEILKLDRSFTRDIEMHPQDLTFVQMTLSLAQGLERRLVVEGIETPEAYDALRILGVELGQGYAISRPIPQDEIEGWLAAREPHPVDNVPQCLLAAYASHLNVVQFCLTMRRQPLPVSWSPTALDHCNCAIGKLFTRRDWHATAFGEAHRRFHARLFQFDRDEMVWRQAVHEFQQAMATAIADRSHAYGCAAGDQAQILRVATAS
jgi:EAL domain-containing protein (putative c-di-GMP-specific phosphodiesterase class I)